MKGNSDERILRGIAVFKLCKCVALILIAIGAFEVAQASVFGRISHWLHHLPLAEGHLIVHDAIVTLLGLTPQRIHLIGFVACGYACLFGIEGYGLWRERRWAEYLTVVATASLIPFEIWAMVEKLTALRVLAVLVNMAIVAWLLRMLVRKRGALRVAVGRGT